MSRRRLGAVATVVLVCACACACGHGGAGAVAAAPPGPSSVTSAAAPPASTIAAPPPPLADAGCTPGDAPALHGTFEWLPTSRQGVLLDDGVLRLLEIVDADPPRMRDLGRVPTDDLARLLPAHDAAHVATIYFTRAIVTALAKPVAPVAREGRAIGFDAAGRRFFSRSATQLSAFDLDTGREATLAIPERSFVTFPSGGPSVAVVGDTLGFLWNAATGTRGPAFSVTEIGGVVFSPDSRMLAVRKPAAPRPGGVDLVDVGTGAPRGTPLVNTRCDDATTVAFRPDAGRVAVGGRTAYVCIWDLAGPRLLHEFDLPVVRPAQGPVAPVEWLAFTPNGAGLLAAAGTPGVARDVVDHVTDVELYRVSDAARLSSLGTRLPPIPLDDGSVLLEAHDGNAVLVSPDLRVAEVPVRAGDGPISGARIVARRDGALRVLAIATGEVLGTLEDSADDYRPLSFSPGGDLLAGTQPERGTVRIWDAKTGALRAPACAPSPPSP